MERRLSFGPDAAYFMGNSERILAASGLSPAMIESYAAHVIDNILIRLPKGLLEHKTNYMGKDNQRDGYSMYWFSTTNLYGSYSCSPYHVHVIEIRNLLYFEQEAKAA